MGCSLGDGSCYADEKPAHDVEITKGFWLGQTEATQSAYQRVKGKNPSDLPVEQVTWHDAQEYCRSIGGRLPTEAEREYAARAGRGSARYGELDRVGWYDGNSGEHTRPVGQKAPNDWSLYDMLGNVWEWTSGWFDANYYRRREIINPQGPSNGAYRTLRGGSWEDLASDARVSNRLGEQPGNRSSRIGFRCVGE
jgi:formylglycine-generating enzyme required for sulfatase activity